MYKEIFDKLTDAILILENDTFVYCNDRAVEMLDYKDKKSVLNTHPAELSPEYQPDGRTSFEKVMENTAVVREKGHRTFEWIHLRANGEPFLVEVQLSDMQTADKLTVLVVWKEIEEHKKLKAENKYQQMLLNSVLNSSEDLIFYKDYMQTDGKYIGCNDAFVEFVGKSRNEIIGKNAIDLFGEEVGNRIRTREKAILQNKTRTIDEEWATYPDGKMVLFQTVKTLLKDDNGKVVGLLGVSRDTTNEYNYKDDLKKSIQKQKSLASIDSLTGIKNRRSFFEVSQKLFDISKRSKNELSLWMIDIDLFKNINDSYGHVIGDYILRYVVNTIRLRLRQSDIFARYGGEEFIVLLPNTDLSGSTKIAEEICKLFSNNCYEDEERKIAVTVSIGTCQYMNEQTLSQLIEEADKALYKAKMNGRNRVECYKG